MILLGGFMMWVGINIFALAAVSVHDNRTSALLGANGICLFIIGLVVLLSELFGQC